jgi:hypothetical protein
MGALLVLRKWKTFFPITEKETSGIATPLVASTPDILKPGKEL